VVYLPTTTQWDEVKVETKEGLRASSLNGWLLIVLVLSNKDGLLMRGKQVNDSRPLMLRTCGCGGGRELRVQDGIMIRRREFHGEASRNPKRRIPPEEA
jgi:hypothetical protein